MEGIQFENEQEFARPVTAAQGPRGMVALVMKWGLAKDEKTAQYVLLGVVIGAILLAFLIPILFGNSHTPVSQAQIDAALQHPR